MTKKGLELTPIVIEIYRWGAKYTKENNTEVEFKDRVNSEFTEVTNEIMEKLKTTHNIV